VVEASSDQVVQGEKGQRPDQKQFGGQAAEKVVDQIRPERCPKEPSGMQHPRFFERDKDDEQKGEPPTEQ